MKKVAPVMAVVVFLITTLANVVSVYGSSTAEVFSTPINLSSDSYRAVDPNVQNSGPNVYVSGTEGSHGIYFRASSDEGVTWSPPTTSPALRISTPGGTTQYPLMKDSGSYVYVVWSP